MPRRAARFVFYIIGFFVAWPALWVWGVYPWAVRRLGDATLAFALAGIFFRFAIWVVPVFLYLRFVDRVDPFEYLRLRLHWRRGVASGVVVGLIDFTLNACRYGWPHWHHAYLTWNSVLSTSILIGFFEEVPFRGFMLQKLEEWFSFWTAAVISSVLFVAIHLPGWVMLGMLNLANVAFVFALGMIMAILLRYTKSLWAPFVAHSLNDFISGVLFHG